MILLSQLVWVPVFYFHGRSIWFSQAFSTTDMKCKLAFILLAISSFLLKIEASGITIPLFQYEKMGISRLRYPYVLTNRLTVVQVLMIAFHFALLFLPLLGQKKHSKIKLTVIPIVFFGFFIYLSGILNFIFIICLSLWIYASLQYVRDEREMYDHKDIEF